MQDGQLSIVQASVNGVKVDQDLAVKDITSALTKTGDSRHVDLKLPNHHRRCQRRQPGQLGIKELNLGRETTFPGSTSSRLTNVRRRRQARSTAYSSSGRNL